MAYRNDGEGLHRSIDPADGRAYVYAMCFLDAAPSVFACFDQPDLKAPFTVTVSAPAEWEVAGNARATQIAAGRWRLGPTPPLATYLFTVVAGPYHSVYAEHDGIALSLKCRQSLAEALDQDAAEIFAVTAACFDECHRLFGSRYAFGDYHQVFVPDFNAGAMENPGCVLFRDQHLFPNRVALSARCRRATIIAHELAHQWFGNAITPVWWDDLWLNEAFAEYLGTRVVAEVTECRDAWEQIGWSRRTWRLTADQRPSTHPVAGAPALTAAGALQNFDGISYVKGAAIVRLIAATIGDEAFFGGPAALIEQRPFGNVTMRDVITAWEAAGAGDLSELVDEWLTRAGVDTFTLDRNAGVLHPHPHPHRAAVRCPRRTGH